MFLVATVCVWLQSQPVVQAGMPSVNLSEVGRMRLSTISFFAVVVLIVAWTVQRLWNGLHRDFPRLPFASYKNALAIVILWGLVFVIVLTMISGARELMTPGAWVRSGVTYKLNESDVERADAARDEMPSSETREVVNKRIEHLRQLWHVLAEHRAENDGRFPSREEFELLPAAVRVLPGTPAVEYIYHSRQEAETSRMSAWMIAVEPAIFESSSFALYSDGVIAPVATTGAQR